MSATTFATDLFAKRTGRIAASTIVGHAQFATGKAHAGIRRQPIFWTIEGDVELWRISARVGALNDVDYGEFKNDIRDQVEPVLAAVAPKDGRPQPLNKPPQEAMSADGRVTPPRPPDFGPRP